MEHTSEYIWYLKFKISVQERQLESFRNGNAYTSLRNDYEAVCRKLNQKIKHLESDLAKSHSENVTMRKKWSEIFDDLDKEHSKDVSRLESEIHKLKEHIFRAEGQRDKAKAEATKWRKKYYEQSEQIEELEGLNKKLTAQVNKDFQNSSIPSSQQGPGRKKIPNSREKTGRKPGGQPGHEGHRLTQRKPTEVHKIPNPKEYEDNPDLYETGEIIRRQRIFLEINVRIVEYQAKVFRSRSTGTRFYAEFPAGYDTDVSYDGTVKAGMFLMNNECNVSLGKTKKYWSEITGGQLDMSTGKISNLTKEFAAKSKDEQQQIYEKLMCSPVLNTDFTNANVNGKPKQVLIVASPSADVAMYYARDHKGHKGIEGTPIADYVGTLIHDHDKTFYNYGTRHQECMQHTGRYAKGSEENEPERTWNKLMGDLIKKMIHYRNSLGDASLNATAVKEFEDEYDRILKIAEKEYEDVPPSDYYREGYNLYRRLVEYKESELLFLHDKGVPPDNSLAERLARVYKRKQKQAIVLRGDESFICLCEDLGVLHSIRGNSDSMYVDVSEIFQRKIPPKEKETTQVR